MVTSSISLFWFLLSWTCQEVVMLIAVMKKWIPRRMSPPTLAIYAKFNRVYCWKMKNRKTYIHAHITNQSIKIDCIFFVILKLFGRKQFICIMRWSISNRIQFSGISIRIPRIWSLQLHSFERTNKIFDPLGIDPFSVADVHYGQKIGFDDEM